MLDDFESRMEARDIALKSLDCLTEQQRDFIVRRYFYSETLSHIASNYAMTSNKIRQFEAQVIRKMQKYLYRKYGMVSLYHYDHRQPVSYTRPYDRSIADDPMCGSPSDSPPPDFWFPTWLPQHLRKELESV